jgi:hypothetical protein
MEVSMKRWALIILGIVSATSALTYHFVRTEEQRVSDSRTKFEKIDRALKALQTSTEMGVQYGDFKARVEELALEYAIVKERADTPDEMALAACYGITLDYYKDSTKLWDRKFDTLQSKARINNMLGDAEILNMAGDELTKKYEIPVKAWPYGAGVQVLNVNEGIQKIWSYADVGGAVVEASSQHAFTPRWVRWGQTVISLVGEPNHQGSADAKMETQKAAGLGSTPVTTKADKK